MRRVRLAPLLGVAATLLLSVAVWQAWQLLRIHRWNAAIGAGYAVVDARAPPAVRFAAAYARASRGDVEGALNAYRELDGAADVRVRRDAKYNSATLYLQKALALQAGANEAEALTFVELAKQSYREVLRDDSGDWDARYNLERALRLAPDPAREAEELPPPPDSRHAPSTAAGASLGLP